MSIRGAVDSLVASISMRVANHVPVVGADSPGAAFHESMTVRAHMPSNSGVGAMSFIDWSWSILHLLSTVSGTFVAVVFALGHGSKIDELVDEKSNSFINNMGVITIQVLNVSLCTPVLYLVPKDDFVNYFFLDCAIFFSQCFVFVDFSHRVRAAQLCPDDPLWEAECNTIDFCYKVMRGLCLFWGCHVFRTLMLWLLQKGISNRYHHGNLAYQLLPRSGRESISFEQPLSPQLREPVSSDILPTAIPKHPYNTRSHSHPSMVKLQPASVTVPNHNNSRRYRARGVTKLLPNGSPEVGPEVGPEVVGSTEASRVSLDDHSTRSSSRDRSPSREATPPGYTPLRPDYEHVLEDRPRRRSPRNTPPR